jgi:hypothetical protein
MLYLSALFFSSHGGNLHNLKLLNNSDMSSRGTPFLHHPWIMFAGDLGMTCYKEIKSSGAIVS